MSCRASSMGHCRGCLALRQNSRTMVAAMLAPVPCFRQAYGSGGRGAIAASRAVAFKLRRHLPVAGGYIRGYSQAFLGRSARFWWLMAGLDPWGAPGGGPILPVGIRASSNHGFPPPRIVNSAVRRKASASAE